MAMSKSTVVISSPEKRLHLKLRKFDAEFNRFLFAWLDERVCKDPQRLVRIQPISTDNAKTIVVCYSVVNRQRHAGGMQQIVIGGALLDSYSVPAKKSR